MAVIWKMSFGKIMKVLKDNIKLTDIGKFYAVI